MGDCSVFYGWLSCFRGSKEDYVSMPGSFTGRPLETVLMSARFLSYEEDGMVGIFVELCFPLLLKNASA